MTSGLLVIRGRCLVFLTKVTSACKPPTNTRAKNGALRDNPILTIAIFLTTLPRMAKNPQHRDLFAGALELMILHSLRVKPMHGYALVKHLQLVSDDLLQVEEGSLYPALQRLLRAGLLESREGISAKGRPTRIYRLTRAGVRHLEREKSGFEIMSAGIARVLAVSKA